MTYKIQNVKKIQEKSRGHKVQRLGVYHFLVTSGTSGLTYHVRLQDEARDGAVRYTGAECTCKWGHHRPSKDRRSGCGHVMAVFNFIDKERTASAWGTTADAKRQHRPVTVIGDGVLLTGRLKRSRAAVALFGDDSEGI